MFIITLTYKAPIEEVDKYLIEHRAFLDTGYQQNIFIASGPKQPRTGGIILSQLKNRIELEAFIKNDPFFINHIADVEITEFSPVKFHPAFEPFVEEKIK